MNLYLALICAKAGLTARVAEQGSAMKIAILVASAGRQAEGIGGPSAWRVMIWGDRRTKVGMLGK